MPKGIREEKLKELVNALPEQTKEQITSLTIKEGNFRGGKEVGAILAQLPNLETLNLSDSRLEKGQLHFLSKLKNLTFLNLSGNKNISETDVEGFKNLSRLKSLNLANTNFDPRLFKKFPVMKKLTELDLSKTTLNEKSFKKISAFENLKTLNINEIELGDAKKNEVGSSYEGTTATHYKTTIENPKILSNSHLKYLKRLSTLSHLSLENVPIKQAGFASLANLEKLEALRFSIIGSNHKFASRSIGQLSKLKALKDLTLDFDKEAWESPLKNLEKQFKKFKHKKFSARLNPPKSEKRKRAGIYSADGGELTFLK